MTQKKECYRASSRLRAKTPCGLVEIRLNFGMWHVVRGRCSFRKAWHPHLCQKCARVGRLNRIRGEDIKAHICGRYEVMLNSSFVLFYGIQLEVKEICCPDAISSGLMVSKNSSKQWLACLTPANRGSIMAPVCASRICFFQ